MITRCSLLLTILISFLPIHKGCVPTATEGDFIASPTTVAVTATDETTTAEATTAEPTTTLTPTTSTTSTTTTTTTTLSPCSALEFNIGFIAGGTPPVQYTEFSPQFYVNTYPVGTTLSVQCVLTPDGIAAGELSTSFYVTDDSGTTFFQDIDNGPAGTDIFSVTCLPSGSYEVVLSTTSNPAQSAIVTPGGSGVLVCYSCVAPDAFCLSPTG